MGSENKSHQAGNPLGRVAGWLLAMPLLLSTIYFAKSLPSIAAGQTFHFRQSWVPALCIELSFALDGLSLLMALLISGIGTLVMIYANGYMAGRPMLGRFYSLLLAFSIVMLGLVLADNLLLLFVFWELTSLCSYFLIGFDNKQPAARAAALQALLITGGGGLALLAGFVLLGQAAGSYEFSVIFSRAESLKEHPLYVPALLLVLAGAFTKSAQFPFHFWLPSAMEAPTPVSAFLHSATMVKAGVYLLARLSPALGDTTIWFGALTGVGTLTVLLGAWIALTQSDLKRILAYSTISSLGFLTLLLGIGGAGGAQAAMVFLLAHALYKGALFFIAGAVDHATGTRDLHHLSGLGRIMPITALVSAVAAFSMAGLPPTLGFVGKELSYEATLHGVAAPWLTGAAVVANILLVAAAGLVGLRPFFGKRLPTPNPPHEVSLSLLLGPLTLAGLGVALSVWPTWFTNGLLSAASSAVLQQQVPLHLAFWHGATAVLGLSVVTLAGGIAVYLGRRAVLAVANRTQWFMRHGPACWYDWALRGLNLVADTQTRLLQSGYLRYYLMITIGATIALVGYALLRRDLFQTTLDWTDVRYNEAALAALILLAVLASVLLKARLAAIAALGVVGYGVSLIFVLFGAPDLAMTQFLIETLTVILFVLVFYHLPESRTISSRTARFRDAIIAVGTGVLMTALVLIGTPENYTPISAYFEEHSVPSGHGRNVVNVILVDFRGVDTLGEITVLTVAAVGVYALLKLRGQPQLADAASEPAERLSLDHIGERRLSRRPPISTSFILRSTTRLLLPLLLLFSIFLLLRGHNEPGGGFSGALVAASAFILYRFAFGIEATRRVFPLSPLILAGAGLLIAAGSGALSLLTHRAFMTGLWQHVSLPGFGSLDLGTPLLFDLGVFVTVLGVTLSIILPLAEE